MFDKEYFKEKLFDVFQANKSEHLLNDAVIEKFSLFTEILLRENEKYNLTAIKEIDKIILLHYADSLLFSDSFEKNSSVIDVGCGAGFPSLPLAICRPDLHITAMDATAKKVNFVAMVSKELSLNVRTVCARAEDVAKVDVKSSLRESFDHTTARAVADLTVLCELCLPLTKLGGSFIVMKGKNGKEELSRSKNAIDILGGRVVETKEHLLYGSEENYERIFAKIVKEKKTPPLYPRSYSQIHKKPL